MTKIQLIEPDVIFWRTPLKWIVLFNIIILFVLLYFVVYDSNNRGFKKIEYKILISQICIQNEKVVLVGKNLNTQKKMILSNKSTLFLSQ